MGRCPWHEDSTPSLSVDQEKGLYNCFGCGESGDAFDLVMKEEGTRLSICGEVFERGGL
jgi:DNA primase